MSTNYDLNSKSSNLQSNRDSFKHCQQYISNIQNVSQNLQNFQTFQNFPNFANFQTYQPDNAGQSSSKPPSSNVVVDLESPPTLKLESNRNLNTNQKSMISPETHTHFKKQKLQNLKNEDYSSSSVRLAGGGGGGGGEPQSQPRTSGDCALNLFGQFNQTDQLNQSDRPSTNYSESFSSDSSSAHCSPAPSDQLDQPLDSQSDHRHQLDQIPLNLIKNQDTSSSSSNETKEDVQSEINKDSKLDSSMNSSTNSSSIYGSLIVPTNSKFATQSTNSDSSSNNAYDKIELIFTKQPAKYHRARYMTEGSRGPIRDKSGKSFPTIKLLNYNSRPVKAYCYLIDDKQIHQPHLFYQASKLTSRCLTNCVEIKFGNTIALEFELHPRNDMELMIDCLGIVKQRLFEIQQQQHNQEKSHFKTPYCR